MQYIIGAAAAVFFVCSYAGVYFLGYRRGKVAKPPRPKQSGPDEQQKHKAEQLQAEFEIMTGYNLATALKRKKV